MLESLCTVAPGWTAWPGAKRSQCQNREGRMRLEGCAWELLVHARLQVGGFEVVKKTLSNIFVFHMPMHSRHTGTQAARDQRAHLEQICQMTFLLSSPFRGIFTFTFHCPNAAWWSWKSAGLGEWSRGLSPFLVVNLWISNHDRCLKVHFTTCWMGLMLIAILPNPNSCENTLTEFMYIVLWTPSNVKCYFHIWFIY